MKKKKALGKRDTDMRIYGVLGVESAKRLVLIRSAKFHNINFVRIVANQ